MKPAKDFDLLILGGGIAGNLASDLAVLLRKEVVALLPVHWEDAVKNRRFAIAAPSAEHFYLTGWLQRRGVRSLQIAENT